MEEYVSVDDNLQLAIEYSESKHFEGEIDRFKEKYLHLFHIQNSKDENGDEEQVILYCT